MAISNEETLTPYLAVFALVDSYSAADMLCGFERFALSENPRSNRGFQASANEIGYAGSGARSEGA